MDNSVGVGCRQGVGGPLHPRDGLGNLETDEFEQVPDPCRILAVGVMPISAKPRPFKCYLFREFIHKYLYFKILQ
jgi:hypothetical protein